jgi:hypothetical protein
MSESFLYRGVSEKLYCANGGLLKPKAQGPFEYTFQFGERGHVWGDGSVWGPSSINAVIRHQRGQEGFPTSGISTTPHLHRAAVYARGRDGRAHGYVYEISRQALELHGVSQFVVAQFCKPSIPEDDEVILVTDGSHLPPAVVTKVIDIPFIELGTA